MKNEVLIALIGTVVGSAIGACLTWFCSIGLRNSEKWKLFQEEIGIIKSKFLVIDNRSGIGVVAETYRVSLESLTSAVCRIQPYISNTTKRARLLILLDDYRTAEQRKDGGFMPADLAGNLKDRPGDLFSDPPKAVRGLIAILDKMLGL